MDCVLGDKEIEYAVSFAIIDYAAGARKQVPPPFGKEKLFTLKK